MAIDSPFPKSLRGRLGEASAGAKHSDSVTHGGWDVQVGWRMAGGSTVTFSITHFTLFHWLSKICQLLYF